MREQARRILGTDLGDLGVAAVGFPMQFRSAAIGFAAGMDVRVGLEDSLRVERGRLASSNAELVGVAIRLAATLVGNLVADWDEQEASRVERIALLHSREAVA